MKKKQWMLLALFAALSAFLRILQNATGFEDSGLAVRGNLPGLLLPVVLAVAVGCFFWTARELPMRRDAAKGLADSFHFEDTLVLTCAVSGAFLICGSAVLTLAGFGPSGMALLTPLAVVSGVCLLYTVFTLYRGGEPQGLALLAPVCCLAVYLVFLYRADASDPVLAHIYIEILAVAALTFAALERAAFSYRDGAPRIYVVASALAVILSVTVAAQWQSLASVVLYVGCALIELGFLAAATV